ncbi:16511_t:CDS:2, partial [Dentiscutata erythropus]
VFELIKKYLPFHILSVQKQQIEGSLLYHATLISKESASLTKEDLNQLDCDDDFLEDQLDRPQTSLCSLLIDIQLSDIVEVWELFGITKSYKHYVSLLNDEDIQDQDGQLKLQETVEVKKALNLALDLNCEDEFLDTISNFITCKKSSIQSISNEENLCVLDPLVQKRRGRQPNKHIKLTTEKSHHSSSGNSAINPPNPNLTSRVTNNENQINTYVSNLSIQK